MHTAGSAATESPVSFKQAGSADSGEREQRSRPIGIRNWKSREVWGMCGAPIASVTRDSRMRSIFLARWILARLSSPLAVQQFGLGAPRVPPGRP